MSDIAVLLNLVINSLPLHLLRPVRCVFHDVREGRRDDVVVTSGVGGTEEHPHELKVMVAS
jgi:hypothetical protein